MKKLFALLMALTLMLSAVAFAEEVPATDSPVPPYTVISFTPDGIVPGVTNPELDSTVQQLLDAITNANDNEAVFGSSGVADLSQYELIELFGLTLAEYDTTMGPVTLNIKLPSAFEQTAQYVTLLGLINGSEVTWQSLSFQIEQDGSLTITLTPEQAEAVMNSTAVGAVLQKIAE